MLRSGPGWTRRSASSRHAAERAWAEAPGEPFQPPAGAANSLLVNVPALIAIHRSYLAILRGDADATVAFASRALADLGEDERMLEYVARSNLANAEWLRGRLSAAEGTFETSLAPWTDEPTVLVWGRHVFAQIQLAQVHLDAAIQTCQRTLAVRATRPPAPRYRRLALRTSAWVKSPTGRDQSRHGI